MKNQKVKNGNIVLETDAEQKEMLVKLLASYEGIDNGEAEENLELFIIKALYDKFRDYFHLLDIEEEEFLQVFENYFPEEDEGEDEKDDNDED